MIKVFVLMVFALCLAMLGCGLESAQTKDTKSDKSNKTENKIQPLHGFYSIGKKSCDGEAVALAVGERVYINQDEMIVGFGQTDINGCRIVDFRMFAFRSFDSIGNFEILSHREIGRKSSCSEGVKPYAGLNFDSASISSEAGQITIFHTDQCDRLELSIENS